MCQGASDNLVKKKNRLVADIHQKGKFHFINQLYVKQNGNNKSNNKKKKDE